MKITIKMEVVIYRTTAILREVNFTNLIIATRIQMLITSEMTKFLLVNHQATVNPTPITSPIISIKRKVTTLRLIPLCNPKHGNKNSN